MVCYNNMLGDDMYFVYKITNKVNEKKYIGITSDIKRRFYQHVWMLRNNRHHSIKLQRAYNKYGEDSFSFDIIEEVDCDADQIAKREILYIALFDSCDNGYNQSYGGENTSNLVMSEETKQKLSLAMLGNQYSKGCKRSNETKKRMSISMKNCCDMEDRKKRSSTIMKRLWKKKWFRIKMKKLNSGNKYSFGRKMSDKMKKQLSISRQGENNPFWGKKHSDETKELLSCISSNRWKDQSYIDKVNSARNSAMRTEEYRMKQSKLSSGRSTKTREIDAVMIRYRYLCGERPALIHADFPLLSISGLKKICYNNSWNHLPNTKEELHNMIINYQSQK